MITPDGWFDWAEKKPGPPSNRYPWDNTMENLYLHSLEGNYATTRPPVWTGTILHDGTLVQHFPVMAGLPHGGPNANPLGPGFEAEGGIIFDDEQDGEPISTEQVRTYIRIIGDMEEFTGREYKRNPGTMQGLVEHGEVAQTACPSNRYLPLYESLKGEDNMTKQEIELLIANTVLPLVAQIVGPDKPTYTEKWALDKIAEIRNYLSKGGPHEHTAEVTAEVVLK